MIERSRERSSDLTTEHANDRTIDRLLERSCDQAIERLSDRAIARLCDRAIERLSHRLIEGAIERPIERSIELRIVFIVGNTTATRGEKGARHVATAGTSIAGVVISQCMLQTNKQCNGLLKNEYWYTSLYSYCIAYWSAAYIAKLQRWKLKRAPRRHLARNCSQQDTSYRATFSSASVICRPIG